MSFFYNYFGDVMKVYIDLVLLLNFGFDFLLLLSVSLVLRRNVPLYKLFIGAFIGSFSIFSLFIHITSLELFFLKVIISIFMVLLSFGFRSFKYFIKNLVFLYLSSIALGGGLYFFNIQMSYQNQGIIFYKNKMGVNFFILVILSLIIIYIYIKECRCLKVNYSNYHKVLININDFIINCTGFLDTGNKLRDPYKRRPIILINNNYLPNVCLNKIIVPTSSVGGVKLIECVSASELFIDGIKVKRDVLVGFIDKINIDGVDCLLNCKIMEE